MRTETQDNIKIEGIKGVPNVDIIQETRKHVKGMDQKERFHIAKQHLLSALDVKSPRLDIFSPCVPRLLRKFYNIQTSIIWRNFLLALSYILMYLVIWQSDKPNAILVSFQSIILLLLWADVGMQIYHKNNKALYFTSKFQMRFYVKVAIIIFVFVDLIVEFSVPGLPVRPLLVARCFLPLFYDASIRKAFQALLLAYKDIFVLLFFYASVLVGFSIIANQIIQLPDNVAVDEFSNNYRELDKTVFIMYALSTYDAFPDNQLVAIRNSLWIYGFFICFIILNIFFFATIPPILVFNSFRQSRSKIVLIDQIKQQHSLIMSFVSLGQENLNISQEKMIKFLVYVYKNKVRYVDHIAHVCCQLDQNNNKIIHIKQYMHLCQILQSKSTMLPPKFDDWNRWIKFRKNLNDIFKLKIILTSKKFKIFSSVFILFSFVNCLLSIYTKYEVFDVIDDILIAIFVFQIVIKIMGLGIQNFFNNPWNKLDFFLISTGLVLELLPKWLTPHNSDVLVKMTRVFRVTTLIKTISKKKRLNIGIYVKVTRLVSQIAIIMPIVLKFLPLYMVTFYILGTTGIQIFRESNIQNTDHSPYSTYEQFSNFKTFVYSQFLLMQVLVQSQWSTLAYDYAFKYKSFGLVVIFFVFSHALLVTIITSLIKGVTWEVYNSVHEEFNERMNMVLKSKLIQQDLQKKKQDIDQIKARINDREYQIPLNMVSKELYENKIDELILRKIKQNYENTKRNSVVSRKRRRSEMITYVTQDYNPLIDELQVEGFGSRNELVLKKQTQFIDANDIEGQDDLQKEDIQEQMQKILNKIVINHKIQYSEVIIYPKILTEFLQRKIKPLKTNFMDIFDKGEQQYECDDLQDVFIDGINNLLDISISQRQQKNKILKEMVNEGVISQQQSTIALTKKYQDKDFSIDSDFIMRKSFLSDTNEKLIKKFQIQYFSNVYGKSFKQINKVTLQPLLRLQSKIIYSLRNVLRYRKISENKFFTVISKIQEMISNQILKRGSLFKFVYQINSISDIWFTVDIRESHEIKLRFIKNGIWIYHKSMKHDEIMIGQDIFNCDYMSNEKIKPGCQKYAKMLFQSFQSLGFCVNQQNFLKSDPLQYIYNLFTLYKQTQEIERIVQRQAEISKIMVVILSKQDQREQKLSYPLTDLQFKQQKKDVSVPFRLGESQNETFRKLKQMELMDHEIILQSEGMPFNYIANLMIQIQDLLKSYEHNFVYQLQRLINNKFNEPFTKSS